jgi:uncharacterized glyoxalase superfamily protein PhnB
MPWTHITPQLPVRDHQAARRFYLNVLGCSDSYHDADLAIVVRDELEFQLVPMRDEAWRGRPTDGSPVLSGAESFLAGTVALRVTVDDAAALFAELAPHGCIHPNGKLSRKPWGATEFTVLDPDGNCLTFVQWDD